ncbi:MAG: SDR family NAD(P)-dependent oxidoreductase [Candidatus Limnocylindria bacterium]
MRRLENRVAIVTGAGSGLGRAHALYLAGHGAAVVVNDLGTSLDGQGRSDGPADAVAGEIVAAGGRAVASNHDIADWEQAGALVQAALDAFGRLDVLVNNAGNLIDRTLANMTGSDWEPVVRVHLTGHAATTAHAMAYWRGRAKAGQEVKASVVHTTSVAGLSGNFGQANYCAAKAGIIGLSKVAAIEGARIGVRSNAISPSARTRMAASVPGSETLLAERQDGAFDWLDPANVSPLVGWLAEADCPATNQVFHLVGQHLFVVRTPVIEHELVSDGRWTAEQLDEQLAPNLVEQAPLDAFFEAYRDELMAAADEAPTPA